MNVQLATIVEEGSVNLTAERYFVVAMLHYNKILVNTHECNALTLVSFISFSHFRFLNVSFTICESVYFCVNALAQFLLVHPKQNQNSSSDIDVPNLCSLLVLKFQIYNLLHCQGLSCFDWLSNV